MDVGWMVGESGIKANSAQFSWGLAELGKITQHQHTLQKTKRKNIHNKIQHKIQGNEPDIMKLIATKKFFISICVRKNFNSVQKN